MEHRAPLLLEYFNCTAEGNWEHGQNILHRTQHAHEFAAEKGFTLEEWHSMVNEGLIQLMAERHKRPRPGLDDKIIAGWNGLTLRGLANAYQTFGETRFLELAFSKCCIH